jgi:hypothetical protein
MGIRRVLVADDNRNGAETLGGAARACRWGQEEDKADAYAAGFDAHLTKPPDLALPQGLLAVRLREPPAAARA